MFDVAILVNFWCYNRSLTQFFPLISGQIVENENFDTPLTELGLIPTSILNFAWHPEVADEVKQQLGPNASYLKDSILALAKSD